MATTFPTTLQDLDATRGTSTQALNSPSHITHHALEDDTIEALQTKVGIDSSAVTTSLDYILKNTSGGHDHDGTDSKKVVGTNIDVTGLTAAQFVQVNAGGTALATGKAVPSGVVVGTTDTQTLTNKTLTFADNTLTNVASLNTAQTISAVKTFSADPNLATGVNIQVNAADPVRGAYIPASAIYPATTAGCAALAQIETATNKLNMKALDFDQSTEKYAHFVMPTPTWWDAGTITAAFYWTTTGTGDCIWGIAGVALANDDVLDTALGTAVTVTDTVTAANDLMLTAYTSAVTIGNTPTAGDLVDFRIYRDADAGGDTVGADCRLLGVVIRFTMAQYNDV